MFQTLYKKCLNLAAHKSSNFYLGLVSFIESSFFPIPPDAMIIPMVIAKKKEFIKIFLIASIFSVLGGILGYLIGYLFFDLAMYVIDFYNYGDKVKNLKFSLFALLIRLITIFYISNVTIQKRKILLENW